MENITTELKLRVAYLENKLRTNDEKYIDLLNESDELITSLMIDVANYKKNQQRIRRNLEKLLEELDD